MSCFDIYYRVRGWVHLLLRLPMDWANYNYVVKDAKGITVFWDARTTFDDGTHVVYYGKRKAIHSAEWVSIDTYVSPVGGYRVYDPSKKEARTYIEAYDSVEKPFTFYTSPILYPCQGEGVLSLVAQRNRLLIDLGAKAIRYDSDGGILWSGVGCNAAKYSQICTAFRQDRKNVKHYGGVV